MTETTPEHLTPKLTDRGFGHLPPIQGAYGGNVAVYESSAASGPHIWLCATPAEIEANPDVTVHLSLESAEHLRDQLTWLIENHYQVRS